MGGGEVFYQRFFSKLLTSLKGVNPEGGNSTDWTKSLADEDLYEDYHCDDFDDMYDDYYDSDDDEEERQIQYDESFSTTRNRFVSPDWEIS